MRTPSRAASGKVPRAFLERAVFANLGARRRSVVAGPGHGMDNAVISLGGGRVLLATSDPLSVIPAIGLRESAWLTVHLLASDLATSGVLPEFAMFDFNLPAEMSLPSVEAYLKAVGEECGKLDISIVGGHTGRYPGSGFTVVGGGAMLAVADEDSYVTPAMAKPGDSVVITKGAAVGAAAVLAHSFPALVEEREGADALRKARARLRDCSTVRDSTVAASVGLRERVTSMHDATEGGVLGGLSELASAANLPVLVAREKLHVPEEAAAVCRAFGLDPLTTLSEGTLIVTCSSESAEELVHTLAGEGIESYLVGRLGTRSSGRGLWLAPPGGEPKPHSPGADRYWLAYAAASRAGEKARLKGSRAAPRRRGFTRRK